MAKDKRILYVAYGSNLNLRQMSQRCPEAKVVGAAVMRNWMLRFHAVATIERCKGREVPVLVWEISPADEAALDRYEGWPQLYRKQTVRICLNDKTVSAMVYIMNGAEGFIPPSAWYYEAIREGYEDAGFDETILREAAHLIRKENGKMNPTIKEQILAVRDTGETNMFDVHAVRLIAIREDFYELADYLENHKREYSRFILTGKGDESDDAEV